MKKKKKKLRKFIKVRSKGKPLKLPKSYQQRYSKALKKGTRALIKVIKQEGVEILTSTVTNKTEKISTALTKISEIFTPIIIEEGMKTFEDILKLINTKVDENIKVTTQFAIAHDPQYVLDNFQAILEENLALIKSIPEDIIQSSKDILLRGLSGFDQLSITKELANVANLSQRKIDLISRDQTAKAQERIYQVKCIAVGFEYYEWKTSQDGRVSTGKGGHKYLDGRIYKYGKPTAIIDSKGTKGIPSQRVNCRCTSRPIRVPPNVKIMTILDDKHGDYYGFQTV